VANRCSWQLTVTAAEQGFLELVRCLIVCGADVNAARSDGGGTPLQIASQKGYYTIALILLKGVAIEATRLRASRRTSVAFDKEHSTPKDREHRASHKPLRTTAKASAYRIPFLRKLIATARIVQGKGKDAHTRRSGLLLRAHS
jgi:ankyrin repeat protein